MVSEKKTTQGSLWGMCFAGMKLEFDLVGTFGFAGVEILGECDPFHLKDNRSKKLLTHIDELEFFSRKTTECPPGCGSK